MKTITMYKVMWINADGQGEMNADNFNTEKDAEEYREELSRSFKDEEYYVTTYTHREYPSNTAGISGGIDGWEDLYPQDDY
jgi:hypothetical protein